MIFSSDWFENFQKIGRVATVSTLLIFLCQARTAFSQENNELNDPLNISGSISVTNDGISTIPSLSLGEPAVLLGLSIGRRFHFDPEFRYSLKGKPWSMIFRFRYDLVDTEKFYFRVGLNQALSFKNQTAVIDGVSRYAIEARRVLGLELFSNYELGDNISIGMHTIHGHGFDEGIPDYSHFISLYGNVSEFNLVEEAYLNIRPQIFYLNSEGRDGYYIASRFELGWGEIPLTVSSIINRTIETEITGNPDLLWNLSLNFSFGF